jgi:hypothetical protein
VYKSRTGYYNWLCVLKNGSLFRAESAAAPQKLPAQSICMPALWQNKAHISLNNSFTGLYFWLNNNAGALGLWLQMYRLLNLQ